MTHEEKLKVEADVCRALRKQPGESIVAAAKRVMQEPHGNSAWRVAREILSEKPAEAWQRMRHAAKAARRAGLT